MTDRRTIASWIVAGLVVVAGCGGSSHSSSNTTASESTSTTTALSTTQPNESTTTRATATTVDGDTAVLRAYCDAFRASGFADVTLFDDAMRPLLVRMAKAAAVRVNDPTLAADATRLLATERAAVSSTALARVPARIRADVRAFRAEKVATMQHVVTSANGDPSGMMFVVRVESNAGGVYPQLTRIAAFVRTSCPTSDQPSARAVP